MEIKGEEFLKKVKIKQEKEELEEKLTELRQQESQVYSDTQNVIKDEPSLDSQSSPEFDLNISQSAKSAYENIALDEEIGQTTNPDKKRNYLILGLVLIILFLFSILTFKILSSDDEEKKSDNFTTTTQAEQTNQLNTTVDSDFQKIMNEKKKREEEISQNRIEENRLEAAKLIDNDPISDENMDKTINIVKQKEQEQLSETQKIIRNIEEKQVQEKQIIEQETKKEAVTKPKETSPVKNIVKEIESSAPKGYFVQVGAFTKNPSQNYINNIKKANLKYKVYPVEVNGVLYNKVLIGPYSSRAQAKQDIDNIKKKLNLSSAFVLKF